MRNDYLQVIYALNTQNDEHEDFVAKLRSLHEAEIQRLLQDSTVRLQRCEEGFSRERETQLRRIEELTGSIEKVEGERDDLFQAQVSIELAYMHVCVYITSFVCLLYKVSYRKEVEDKLQNVQSEHVQKVRSLTGELEKFKSDQTRQLKEVSQLKELFAKTSSKQMKELKQQHEKEMKEAREQATKLNESLKAELSSESATHAKELEKLRQQYERQQAHLEENFAKSRSALLAEERKKWEERVGTMTDEHAQKEEQLKDQMSLLTKELRSSKDKLALAEQKIKELMTTFEETKVDSSGLQDQLRESEDKVGALQSTLASLRTELDIARDQYKQQSKEMQSKSGK